MIVAWLPNSRLGHGMSAGSQGGSQHEDEETVQLIWPLPPEVLAQMEPETRTMLLQAMQASGTDALCISLLCTCVCTVGPWQPLPHDGGGGGGGGGDNIGASPCRTSTIARSFLAIILAQNAFGYISG